MMKNSVVMIFILLLPLVGAEVFVDKDIDEYQCMFVTKLVDFPEEANVTCSDDYRHDIHNKTLNISVGPFNGENTRMLVMIAFHEKFHYLQGEGNMDEGEANIYTLEMVKSPYIIRLIDIYEWYIEIKKSG